MRISQLLAGTAALAATAGTVALVPRATGTSWPAVADLLGGLDPGRVVVLGAVWFAGLLAYSLVLTASLPGLTTRRALALNLGGSAVANAVPAGGPLSMGLTTAMARSWGFGPARLAGFLTVSNVWTALGRVVVGGVGLAAWSLAGPAGSPAGGGVFAPVVVAAAFGAVVAGSPRRTATVGRAVGRVAERALRRPGLADRVADGAVHARRLALDTSRRSWPRLVAGLTGYSVLLVVLLDGCLRALGHPAPLVVVLAAVGVERVAAAVPVTPGGAGVADLGVAAVLAAAGALLYRLFTFALEIPVGAAVVVGWLALRGRRPAAGPPAVAAPARDVPARAAA
ncbi:lysylphosphatidylglycerol synthase domain-containing protein [Kineosporia sp. A_224]|uniref:lysylphosphatidylglycerol synthase domain-containing protein n=1 Tax=Kineosporia sp. A_224 TaxID=1962180 RepID=UPI000B4A716B|nr:lysylphosphatidylglycerol synthase domain-containing protein [Kineosporia sp. A_224]